MEHRQTLTPVTEGPSSLINRINHYTNFKRVLILIMLTLNSKYYTYAYRSQAVLRLRPEVWHVDLK